MSDLRARILVVDNPDGSLSKALVGRFARHDVEVARDAFDAIYRIDCTSFDAIFCDLARGDLPGPELWAYLSLNRAEAAARMVFVASGPLRRTTRVFLRGVPNRCVDLPRDAQTLESLVVRRTSWSVHGEDRERESA